MSKGRIGQRGISAAGVVLGIALVGCVSGPPAPAPPAAEAPKAATVPRKGGVVHFSSTSPPATLNYYKEGLLPFGSNALQPVFEGLVQFEYRVGEDYRREFRVVPWLAERWQQPDPQTYVFSIRPGVKWHDGQDFTAADVAFSYEYLRDPKNAFGKSASLAPVDQIEALGPERIRITTKGPSASFLQNLAQKEIVILPKHVADAGRSFERLEGAIGTGAFRFKAHDANSKTVYERFPEYWQQGKPYLDGLVLFHGMDWSARLAAFAAKELDLHNIGDKVQTDALRAAVKDINIENFPSSVALSLYMRVDKPPFDDIRVRRAIHLALDRQKMLEILTFGLGAVNPPWAVSISRWAIPQEELLKLPGYRQPKDADIAEAKRLLREAGYASGLAVSLRYVSTFSADPKLAEVVPQQLKEIGVDVRLEGTEPGVFRKAFGEGDFDFVVLAMLSELPEPSLSTNFLSTSTRTTARINDPKLDQLIQRQATTLDAQERNKTLLEIQRLLSDQLYSIPTIEFAFFQAWRPYLHDYFPNPSVVSTLLASPDMWFDEGAPKRSLPGAGGGSG